MKEPINLEKIKFNCSLIYISSVISDFWFSTKMVKLQTQSYNKEIRNCNYKRSSLHKTDDSFWQRHAVLGETSSTPSHTFWSFGTLFAYFFKYWHTFWTLGTLFQLYILLHNKPHICTLSLKFVHFCSTLHFWSTLCPLVSVLCTFAQHWALSYNFKHFKITSQHLAHKLNILQTLQKSATKTTTPYPKANLRF